MQARSSRLWLSGLCAALFLASSTQAAILRVKADAPGPGHDGTSWPSAFLAVQSALGAAASGDEVWVAAGTYVGNVTLKSGIALYGGFAGTESERAQRSASVNVTILDGNKTGSVITARSDVTQVAIVDGFTIRNGSGTFEGSGPYGGGFYGTGATVTLSNNVITGNYLESGCSHCGPSGSAIAAGGGTYVIRGNRIEGNDSTYWLFGPAISLGGTYTLIGNVIRNNGPDAAILASDSGRIVSNLIQNNKRGIMVYSTGTVTIANSTIVGNRVGEMWPSSGEAILLRQGSATIVNNIIAFNDSGIQRESDQFSVVLRNNNVFRNWFWDWTDWHVQDYQGIADPTGTAGNISADPRFVDPATADFRLKSSSPCIDAGDDAAVLTGETDLAGNTRVAGAHVDIGAYEAAADQIAGVRFVKRDAPGPVHDGRTWETAFLTVQAALDASEPGGEVWVASGTYTERITIVKRLGLYGGFAGTEAAREERDPIANVSILDGGAAGTVVTITVDAASAAVAGFTIRNGKSEGAGGIDCAAQGVTLSHNIITGNRSTDKGGAGGIRVAANSVRILDNVISDNVLEDRTGLNCFGGGIRYVGTYAEIGGNRIINNRADGWSASGGGLYFSGGKVIIHENVVIGNRAEGDSSQDPVSMRSMVSGGGMAVCSDGPQITHNVITGNTAFARANFCHLSCEPGGLAAGGGMSIAGLDPDSTILLEVENNLFADNRADGDSESRGGGLSAGSYGRVNMIGNTFAGNTLNAAESTTSGAAVFSESIDSTLMANNIVAFNDGATGPAIYIKGTSSLATNDVFGNSPASFTDKPADPTGTNGNISADPLFVDRAGSNYRLSAVSPAIDTGSMASSWSTDLDGKKRRIGPAVDMGAYEAPLYAVIADAALAVKGAGGLSALAPAEFSRLNALSASPETVDVRDAVALARRAVGLDQ